MTSKLSKKVLVAPLDWGLGHASRCIPLISTLQKEGCNIVIAASGAQQYLLQREFPNLEFITLKGYSVSYTRHKRFFSAKILWQIPKILLRIRQEHQWIAKIVEEKKIDLIISDNRYGLYSTKVPCVFITHQLTIKAPAARIEKLMQRVNYRLINRFTQCWVPDFAGEKNIAGILSHPQQMPVIKTCYLGPLSRFSYKPAEVYLYKYLFVISGPEPQRTMLQNLVLEILPKLDGNIMVVLGLPEKNDTYTASENVIIKSHLDTAALEQAFLQSEFIVSRSGYTTVMELLALRKKAILVPTPGQTEQEYLAHRLMEQHWCYTCSQHDDLAEHIQQATTFGFESPGFEQPLYEKVVKEFLGKYCKSQ